MPLFVVTAWLAPRKPFSGPPGSFHRRNRDTEMLTALWNQTSIAECDEENEADEKQVLPNVSQFPSPRNEDHEAEEQEQEEKEIQTSKEKEAVMVKSKNDKTKEKEKIAMELLIDESLSLSRYTTNKSMQHETTLAPHGDEKRNAVPHSN